jgi:phage terminase large subunit-like protein
VSDIPLSKSRKELLQIAAALEALDKQRRYNRISFFEPYPKQVAFFDLGSVVRERMLRAGNQIGKSEAGAVEMTYHLTGDYPDDWMGHKFDRGITAWACGVTASDVRDISQSKLFGEPGLEGSLGTGFVPKDKIIGNPSLARGVTDAFDTVHIRHKSGGVSTLRFKSYEQGVKKFQGKPVDVIWLDEEPEMEIYLECKARTLATRGIMFTTFTPLNGRTPLFIYMTDPTAKAHRQEILMTFRDVPGLTPEMIEERLAAFPAYQREARLNGVPMQGSGRIFITPESNVMEPTIKFVPPQWYKLWAIDFGINENHKFAAVLQAWDKDTDIIHILHAFKIADQTPLQHAVTIKNMGILVPVAWPHDGGNRERGSGEALSKLYKKQGLRMCDEHATFEDGGYSTEAGIIDMDGRMKTARYKVAAHLSEWFEEYRDYHRKDGLIVKQNDDIMSASRIGLMAKRFGKPVILGGKKPVRGPNDGIATDAELSGSDLF